MRGVEGGGGRRGAVAGIPGGSISGDRADHARRRDLADDVVIGVGDVDISRGIDSDAIRDRKLGGGRRGAVTGVAVGSVSGDGLDDAGRLKREGASDEV